MATQNSVDDHGLETLRKAGMVPDDTNPTRYALRNVLYDASGNAVQISGGKISSSIFDSSGNDISTIANSQNYNSLVVSQVEKAYPPFIGWMTETYLDDVQTLAADTVKDAYTVTLTNATAYVAGNNFVILGANQIYTGFIISKSGNVLTMDSPINAVFPSGTNVVRGSADMNVDGSVTPRIFTIRGGQQYDPTGIEIVIHRIFIFCLTSGIVNLSKFADIAGGITRGLLLRYANDATDNIFNIKTNLQLAGICYDWTPFVATNPAQGSNGFISRLSFGGSSKMGTSILLKDGDTLEMWVQDNLSTITRLRVVAEGYIRPVT